MTTPASNATQLHGSGEFEFGSIVDHLADVAAEFLKFGRDWSFDTYTIYKLTRHDISVIAPKLAEVLQFEDNLRVDLGKFKNFYKKIEKLYNDNPYHNSRHGTEVAHATLYFCNNTKLTEHLILSDLNAVLIASFAHDVGHPGVNNRFLINARNKLSLRYNDQSILENMHASKVYTILADDVNNFMILFTSDEWFETRKMVVEMILETDMAKHFDSFG
jgi:hypothetical protein